MFKTMLLTWGFAITIGGLLSGISSFNAFRSKGAVNHYSDHPLISKRHIFDNSYRKRDLCCLTSNDDSFLVSNVEENVELPIGFDDTEIESVDVPKANRQLIWNAAVKSSVRVKEAGRTCEEYMRLPASEYSVLSANQITRLSDSEFKCELPTMNFFGTKIQPVLYVDVNVYPEFNRSEIVVRRAETVGSETADKVNGTFSISAINIVSAATDDEGRKTLNSDTKLVINVLVPPSRFPLRVIQSGGNFIMQSSLNIIVPTFVRILSADFQRWSAGNDTRAEVEGAVLSTS